MYRVLVLDANERSALAIIRSLGRQGLAVVAGDRTAQALGAASRYATAAVSYPDPSTAPGAFREEIAKIAERMRIDLVVPATDLTTMLLATHPDRLRSARLAAPPADSYEALTDKARLMTLAQELGVLVPETRIVHTAAAAEEAAHELGFPIVLKPGRSRYLKGPHIISTSVQTVRSARQLADTLPMLDWLGDIPCLVQRFVPGRGAGIFALYDQSGPVTWFAHKRLREKPPTGGVSVLSESTDVDAEMLSAAKKLLSAARWVGVAMVEFRVAPDGAPYLMEVNGRFWGSLQLAVDCGVDFPWLLCQVMRGLPVQGPASYVIGRRLRWLLGDLDSLILDVRRGAPHLRRISGALGTFLKTFVDRSCRQEIFRISDPRPGMREVRLWLEALRK